jgi:hypothetical protein
MPAIGVLAEGMHHGHAHQFTDAQTIFDARQGFADENEAGGGGAGHNSIANNALRIQHPLCHQKAYSTAITPSPT